MKNRRKFFLFGLLVLCIAAFCGVALMISSLPDAAPAYSSPAVTGMVTPADYAPPAAPAEAPANYAPPAAPADYAPADYVPAPASYSKAAQYDGKIFQQQAGRKQSFEAVLTLNVTGEEYNAVKQVLALAEKFSGYSVYSNLNRVQVKVPVKKAETFMSEVEKIGTVTSREITSQDVTEQYSDLELRCKNLRALRERFAGILKKATLIEDMLKIKSELARVTTELEKYQGQLNLLKNQVDMVKITISFNSVVITNNESIPVDWVRKLGNAIFYDEFSAARQNKLEKFAVNAASPDGFITLSRNENVLRAINADNCKLQIKHYNDLPGATAEFYGKLIQQQLKQLGFINIECKDIALMKNHSGITVSAVRGDYTYSVAIAFYQAGWLTKHNKVLVIELADKTADMGKVNITDITKGLKF